MAETSFWNSPGATGLIAVVVAGLFVVVGIPYVLISVRRNARRAPGGLTTTEAKLSRTHTGALLVALLLPVLGAASLFVPAVRDALSDLGDHAGQIRLVAVPLTVLYIVWLGRSIGRARRERAERDPEVGQA